MSRQVLAETCAGTGSGDRHHDGRSVQQPGERELGGRSAVVLSDLAQSIGRGQRSGCQERVRHEGDASRLAVPEHVF